jgi:hypothetical protein
LALFRILCKDARSRNHKIRTYLSILLKVDHRIVIFTITFLSIRDISQYFMFLSTKQDEALLLYFLLKTLQFHHFTLSTSKYSTTSSTFLQQKEERLVSEYLKNLKIFCQIPCSDYRVSLYLPSNFFAIIYFLATKNWTVYNPASF